MLGTDVNSNSVHVHVDFHFTHVLHAFTCILYSQRYMYILGLVFGVIGGFITPAFSFILS